MKINKRKPINTIFPLSANLNYDDVREDRKKQKRVKKQKTLKEAKNKRRKKKYVKKDD